MNVKRLGRRLAKAVFVNLGCVTGLLLRDNWISGMRMSLLRGYWKVRLGKLGCGTHIYPHVVIHSPEMVFIGARTSIAEFATYGDVVESTSAKMC